MIYLGKVIPGYAEIGVLRKRIGNCNIKSKSAGEGSVPLRCTQYSPISESRTFLSWQRITSGGEIQVSPDSTLQLNDGYLHTFIHPEDDGPGALLLLKEQITEEVRGTLRKMVAAAGKDLDQGSPWVVLLPGLEVSGKSAICFDISMTGASDEKFRAFIGERRGRASDITTLLKQRKNPVLFINPYYLSPAFLGYLKS